MAVSTEAASESAEPIEVRSLRTQGDYERFVALQRNVWGEDFEGLVPASFVKVSQKVGGVAAGAFDPGQDLIGFVFGLTGIQDRQPVHWSHMLAVRKDSRNRGIGRKLKEFQRELLLPLGIETMYWTFDPLVGRNAHFNLNRLGVTVREYVPDMYGDTGSELHAHGTDRLIVAWRLLDAEGPAHRSGRETTLPGADADLAGAPVANTVTGDGGRPIPSDEGFVDEPVVLIEIPYDGRDDKGMGGGKVGQWKSSVRRAFARYLARGYSVRGFHSDEVNGRNFYVLTEAGE